MGHPAQERIAIWRPHQIVSLLEMLEKYAHNFFQLGQAIKGMKLMFSAMAKGEKDLKIFSGLELPGHTLGGLLRTVRKNCDILGLTASFNETKRIQKWVTNSGYEDAFSQGFLQQYSINLEVLEKLINAELEQQKFLHILTLDAEWYSKHGFSESVQDAFPKSKYDMEESGKSLALGRYPACVFHLMRIVDAGLKRLGNLYDVKTNNPSWDEFLRPLKEKISVLKKIDLEKRQQLGNLIERITAIKEIRNPMTHSDENLDYSSMERIEKKYSPDEARRHFANVKAFLSSLVVVLSWGKLEGTEECQ